MQREQTDILESYPLAIPVEIRFADIDGMGHVNNAKFATYFEHGRTEYWRRAMGARDPLDMDFILARQEIDFLRPIRLDDSVKLGIRLCGIGRTSFRFEYLLLADGTAAARGRSVQVFFDYQRHVKKPVPEGFVDRVTSFQGAVVPCSEGDR